MSENEISWENIKTLYAYSNTGERGGGYDLRVGCWVVNGRKGEPVLERREWWTGKDGSRMAGKQKGLSKQDLYRIFGMAGELSKLLDFPLPKEFGAQAESDKSLSTKNDATKQPASGGSSRF